METFVKLINAKSQKFKITVILIQISIIENGSKISRNFNKSKNVLHDLKVYKMYIAH